MANPGWRVGSIELLGRRDIRSDYLQEHRGVVRVRQVPRVSVGQALPSAARVVEGVGELGGDNEEPAHTVIGQWAVDTKCGEVEPLFVVLLSVPGHDIGDLTADAHGARLVNKHEIVGAGSVRGRWMALADHQV